MKKSELTDRAGDVLDELYPNIYDAERLLYYFRENYLPMNSEAFDNDEKAQKTFVHNYDQMEAQLHVISEILFQIRLKTEFALGVDTNITRAYIRNFQKLTGE